MKMMGKAANAGLQGLCKTPIAGGWGEPPPRGRLPVSTHIAPRGDAVARSAPARFQRLGPGLSRAGTRGRWAVWPPLPLSPGGAAPHAQVVWYPTDAPGLAGRFGPLSCGWWKRDEFMLLLLGQCRCFGHDPQKLRDALVTGGGRHACRCVRDVLGSPGKRGSRGAEGWSASSHIPPAPACDLARGGEDFGEPFLEGDQGGLSPLPEQTQHGEGGGGRGESLSAGACPTAAPQNSSLGGMGVLGTGREILGVQTEPVAGSPLPAQSFFPPAAPAREEKGACAALPGGGEPLPPLPLPPIAALIPVPPAAFPPPRSGWGRGGAGRVGEGLGAARWGGGYGPAPPRSPAGPAAATSSAEPRQPDPKCF